MINKLNVGCGPDWKTQYPDYIGIDKQNFGQEYVIDALEMGEYFDHNFADEIMANHFLEHFWPSEIVRLLNIWWDILKPEGIVKVIVPHKHKDKAWQLTHKTYFTEETFRMLEDDTARGELGLKDYKLVELVTNDRLDIYCELLPRK